MKLSTQARYALRSMITISRLGEDDEPVSLERVAKHTHLSKRYLEQLAMRLRRASLIRGVSGRHGGYVLERRPEDINVGHIVEAAIGPVSIVDCVVDPEECVLSDDCECRVVYCRLNEKIKQVLSEFTLADLVSGQPKQ